MAYKIVWTKRARANLSNIIEYLIQEFSLDLAKEFNKKIFTKADMLLNFPKLGSVYDGKVRRLVIAKQCSIFYRVQDDEISFLNVFENRQNPRKIR